jgi:hypothetical protein
MNGVNHFYRSKGGDFHTVRNIFCLFLIGQATLNTRSSHKRALLQTEIFLSFISSPGGWSQTNPQVKKSDVEVLGWRGYTWSAVVRLVGHTAKFFKMTLAYELSHLW